MFRMYVLQNPWVIMALLGGISLMIYFVLAYLGMWRPRETQEGTTTPDTSWSHTMRYLPWFLIVTFIATAIYNICYCIYIWFYPPDW